MMYENSGGGEILSEDGDGVNPVVALAFENMAEPGAGETILLVEDEEFIRRAVHTALEAAGYQVVAAENGVKAKALHSRFSRVPDLLLSDVVMPGMSGPELAKDLLASVPGLRVLLMSGYAEQLSSLANHGEAWPAELKCMAKPFSVATLLSRVRGALDRRSSASTARASLDFSAGC
jgi:DNA-binding response OmpR family regulator